MTNILSRNSKTGYSLNFPAPATCSSACPVKDICYAQKGNFIIDAVKEANEWRLELWHKDPTGFFEKFDKEVKSLLKRGIRYLRIFGSGDYPCYDFAVRLYRLMQDNPEMAFWISSVKIKHSSRKIWIGNNYVIRNSIGLGPYTSAVWRKGTPEPEDGLICPAMTREVKDCDECGHKCWSREVKKVWYKEH